MSPPAVLFQQRLHFARSSSSAPEAAASSHEFRLVYGEDLDRLGEDAVPEAWRRYGLWGLARLLADIAGQVVGGSQGNVMCNQQRFNREDLVGKLRDRLGSAMQPRN